MRDPNRIKPFLNEIEKRWNKVSDWRFGQLIENLKRMMGEQDLFFIEDEEFLKKLNEVFEVDVTEESEEDIEEIINRI